MCSWIDVMCTCNGYALHILTSFSLWLYWWKCNLKAKQSFHLVICSQLWVIQFLYDTTLPLRLMFSYTYKIGCHVWLTYSLRLVLKTIYEWSLREVERFDIDIQNHNEFQRKIFLQKLRSSSWFLYTELERAADDLNNQNYGLSSYQISEKL